MKRCLLIMFLVLGLTLSAQEFPFDWDFWEAVTLAEVQALIDEGADVNARNEYGHTPLMWAALIDNPEIIKVLLAAGAKVNAQDEEGKPPLMWAAGNSNPATTQYLLAAGANVNPQHEWGISPLILAAAKNENPAIMRVLVNAGAEVTKEIWEIIKERREELGEVLYWDIFDRRFE